MKILLLSILILLHCEVYAKSPAPSLDLTQLIELIGNINTNSGAQLKTLKELADANRGNNHYGALLNDANTLKNWQGAPNWDSALRNISGGNETRYRELVTAYDRAHPALDETTLQAASPERLAQFKQSRSVNKAVNVETTYIFNELNERLKNIHELSKAIDQTGNTKGAVDLNSRLMAELSYIQILNLKLQTLISQQLAENSASALSDESEMIRFNTLPDERAP